jgi:hypothetical protein
VKAPGLAANSEWRIAWIHSVARADDAGLRKNFHCLRCGHEWETDIQPQKP